MVLLDWILVVFGVAVAATGSWLQLHPERILPAQSRDAAWAESQMDARAMRQIRVLGSCFVFMGAFFAVQMTVDLTRLPWWTGTIGGFAAAIVAVTLVRGRVSRRRARHRQPFVQQASLPKKVLELR